MTTRLALMCALLAGACRPTGGQEARAEATAAGGAPGFEPSPLGLIDPQLPAREAQVQPFRFPLGTDVTFAVLSSRGWVGSTADKHIGRVTVERPGAATPATAVSVDTEKFWISLRSAPNDVYVSLFGRETESGSISRLDGSRAVRLSGAKDAEWFADTPAGLRAASGDIENREYRWQLYAVSKNVFRPLGDEHRDEMLFGLVAPPGELLVAAGKADRFAHAPQMDQVKAVMDLVDKGDGRAAARLAGKPRGYLLHLSTDGKLVREEPFPDQRPEGIALTDDGWLVVKSGGTLARGLKDAMVVARKVTPAGATPGPWRVLARDLEMPDKPIQRGGWVCLIETPGEASIIHCINPGRALHIVSPRLIAPAALFDIDLRGRPQLVFRVPVKAGALTNQTMVMPLP